jgi:hypothetical protein
MSRKRNTHARSEKLIEYFSCKIFRSHRTWADLAIERKVILNVVDIGVT